MTAADKLREIAAMHVKKKPPSYAPTAVCCGYCGFQWPCPTRRIIESDGDK